MLTDKQDAFGHMVHDYLTKGQVSEVIERDDGLVDIDDGVGYFSEFKKWPSFERRAMRYVRGRVLDVGSGAGRCSLYLQEQGHDVLGIDNSPLALEVCRQRGLKHTELVPLQKLSPKLGIFDTILMMGNNFGLFGNREEAKKMLRKLSGITSRQGRIVAETRNIYQTEVPEHLKYQELNRKKGRMSGQTRIRVRYRFYTGPWFDYLQVSKEEMKDILEGTGWQINKFIDSERSIYVAIIEKKRL
jgi:SAM-dependent methyltransferase